MPKLILLKGLPGSGKSTYAKNLIDLDDSFQRVNRDEIRHMMTNYKFSKKNEKIVTGVVRAAVRQCFMYGLNIVIDETSINPKVERDFRLMVLDWNSENPYMHYDFVLDDSFLDVSLDECLRRNALRESPVPEDVIRRMNSNLVAGA